MKYSDTVKNIKTGKLAKVYNPDRGDNTFLGKYLKDGEPFGPLRDLKKENFIKLVKPWNK